MLSSLACLLAPAGPALAVQAHGDFNGDSFDDLAVGVPREGVGSAQSAGLVNVIYGSPDATCSGSGGALKSSAGPGAQAFSQAAAGVPGVPELGDGFGSALAVGDFNRDGVDDLAIGAPGEAIGSRGAAGLVVVLYGDDGGPSAAGLTGSGSQAFSQASAGVPGVPELGDGFGSALAADDFNPTTGIPQTDLAVGAPGDGVNLAGSAGLVNVLYDFSDGDPGGPSGPDAQGLQQGSAGIPGQAETDDNFGAALTGGLFKRTVGSPSRGLAIGAPGEAVGSNGAAGVVNTIYSNSADGLAASSGAGGRPAAQQFHQNSPGIPGSAEVGDRLGAALAVRNLVGDLSDDLLAGAPGEAIGSRGGAGLVDLLSGSDGSGITGSGAQEFHQDSPGIAGSAEIGDRFGFAIGASPESEGVPPGVAVGVPGEDLVWGGDAGLVNLLFPRSGEPGSFHQDSPGVLGSAEAGDRFGEALAVGDFNCAVLDSNPELAIGVPGEDVGSALDAGLVNVRYSPDTGGATGQQQALSQESAGVPGIAEDLDRLGRGL
jgi:FG-GAP repeat